MTRVQDYIDGIAHHRMSRFTSDITALFHVAGEEIRQVAQQASDQEPAMRIDFDALLQNVIRFPYDPTRQ